MAVWQWSYNGLAFGDGTSIDLVTAEGLDFPEVRTSDQPRALEAGLWPGSDLPGGRTVTLTLELVGVDDATLGATLTALRAAFNVRQASESPLVFELPGDVAKRIYCRTRRRSIPINQPYFYRVPQIVVQLAASDPRIYANTTSSGSAGIAVAGTGLTFNATPNFSFGGAASGGLIAVTNNGDAPAPWTATISGPIVDPRIILASTGEQLALVGSVAAGETLVLDRLTRTILLNGVASRYSWLQTGSVWFDIPVGADSVQFGATSGAGTLLLAWPSSASY